jgi:hypothetical protein
VKQLLPVALTLAAALLGTACSRADIDNKAAVRAAMVEYLDKNKDSTGLDPARMDVNVDAVAFERDTARATVSFLIKGTDQGMQGNYTLSREGDKWGSVKRQNITAAPHGGSIDTTAPPAQTPGQTKEPLLPVPLPGTETKLPAGHPPVDSGNK